MENVRAQKQMRPAAPPAPFLGQPLPWFSLWNGLSPFGGAALERPLTSGTALRKEFGRPWKWLCKSFFGELLSLLKSCLQRVGKPSGGAFWEKWISSWRSLEKSQGKAPGEQPLEEEALESFLEKHLEEPLGSRKALEGGRAEGER